MSLARQLERQSQQVLKGRKTAKGSQAKAEWDAVGINYQVLATDFKNLPTDLTEALDRKVMRGAVRAACAVVRKQMKKDFKKHQSKKTQTRELWTDEEAARQARERAKTVYQSIMVSIRLEKEENRVRGMVGPNTRATFPAWWFEFGRQVSYWGDDPVNGMAYKKPEPFVRPAGEKTRQQQTQAMHKQKKFCNLAFFIKEEI